MLIALLYMNQLVYFCIETWISCFSFEFSYKTKEGSRMLLSGKRSQGEFSSAYSLIFCFSSSSSSFAHPLYQLCRLLSLVSIWQALMAFPMCFPLE